VGNFENISEDAFSKSYLPLIEVLNDHPWFRFNLHFTGPLLEWLVKTKPEYVALLRSMVERGQLELMTGGFYEPILALLPHEDKVGQIRKLTAFVEEHFGQAPKGMWLAERIWEPHLPAALADAGVEHVVVDDFHFKMAGLTDSDLTGYYITSEQDSYIKVFPGSEKLRYTMPFREPEETVRYLESLPDAGENTLAVLADDGEKFGVWPETYRHCYTDGWLRRFLEAVERCSGWLATTTFGAYSAEEPARGAVYLPTCSYMEMAEWSLPAGSQARYERFVEEQSEMPGYDEVKPYIKGGFFRNFLTKYPESGQMHRRMLKVSGKVRQALEAISRKRGVRGVRSEEMVDELWRSQCNDAYWHGVFGGLYLPHLRDAVYRHMMRAELMAEDALSDGGPAINVQEADQDGDGETDLFLSNRDVALCVDPGDGGSIFELDYRPVGMNMMNTLSRRYEAYHDRLREAAYNEGGPDTGGGGAETIHGSVKTKERGLHKRLNYDWYKRRSFLVHFLGPEADLADFAREGRGDEGDFVLGGFDYSLRKKGDGYRLKLEREGTAMGLPVRVEKAVTLENGTSSVACELKVKNLSAQEINAGLGAEFNFSLLAPDTPDRYFDIPGHVLARNNFGSSGELNMVGSVGMVDEWLGYELGMKFGRPATLWRFPVETVSLSEAGFERVYQCSCIMPVWRITLPPGGTFKTRVDLELSRREEGN